MLVADEPRLIFSKFVYISSHKLAYKSMRIQNPFQLNHKLQNFGNRLQITIPVRKNFLVILFLLFWLGGWYIGEVSALEMLANRRSGADLFMLFWLGGWTIGGLFAFGFIIWSLFGVEIVILKADALYISREIFGIGQRKKFLIHYISNVGLTPERHISNDEQEAWNLNKNGKIQFHYNPPNRPKKIIAFGQPLQSYEAQEILQEFKKSNYLQITHFKKLP